MSSDDIKRLVARAEHLMSLFEAILPPAPPTPDWSALAQRWRTHQSRGWLAPLHVLQPIHLSDLKDIDDQKKRVDDNTRQFVCGQRANNVLLTGARGTGKSSIVRAMLTEYSAKGLRVIEVDKADLVDLPHIVDLVQERSERFIIYCDDLSFENGEPGYKALKTVLDGSFAAVPDNVLIYATSNRRHLMPEYFSENLQTAHGDEGELHPEEAVEEKVSLSDRFGLWVSFYSFNQEAYLQIVRHWLSVFGVDLKDWDDLIRREALQWSMMRASRSGRVAWQFARDYSGKAR
ncbi:putative ATP/GTP-binding protein [Candidatus Nitrotoga sp. BS]|uniref:ATP-binding protein n=1 Tax=Candidatus Nitrotoga sp. BS TaxID=2890408 RepID=UPI001EF2769E|nr:ATP-binding protein [Candidatus Nitrotoga sp. BS]CAH1198146.1 putative ATP/GTP-binding protein [Candidatus Nitrotoga sp. BS]